MSEWKLRQRIKVEGVEVAYDVLGKGPPVLLVHGFPSNSYIWRRIAPVLATQRTVYVYDIPGQGASERRDGMDVSDPLQARVIRGLMKFWEIERPAAVLHDIGSTYGMLAYYEEGCRYERIALISAAMMNPCVTTATLHAQKYLEAYRTMPNNLYEMIVRARINSTTYEPMAPEAFDAYLRPWLGPEGQALWFNRVAQISEEPIHRVESRLGPLDVPVEIIWGANDTWIPVDQAERLRGYIRNATIRVIPNGGHFLMEDAPQEVAVLLADFLEVSN